MSLPITSLLKSSTFDQKHSVDRGARVALATRVPLVLTRLDPVFRALADPTRRWIVEQLLDFEASICELAEPHAMSLTAFMRHIHVLEECGLVRTSKLGRIRDCTIQPEPLRMAERWLRLALWRRYSRTLGSLPEDWGFGSAPGATSAAAVRNAAAPTAIGGNRR
jgi:DNA-binding transcriptional ArsR family regulator